MKTVVAGLFACVVLTHSAQLLAQAAQSPVPDAVPTAMPAPAADETPVPDASDDQAEAAAPASDKHDVGVSRLELNLKKIEAERAEYSRFWPWFTVATGVAMTVGGTAVGAGHVFGCDGGCSTSAWIGIIVATGTFVATVGTIWVVHANRDLAEIDSRRYQLEQEIERIRLSSKLPNASDNQGEKPLFSMRFAFN